MFLNVCVSSSRVSPSQISTRAIKEQQLADVSEDLLSRKASTLSETDTMVLTMVKNRQLLAVSQKKIAVAGAKKGRRKTKHAH